MSKIFQFSTIGALMAGYFVAEHRLADYCSSRAFGLGCSTEISGEITLFEGVAYEATAGEPLHPFAASSCVPFVQVTDFEAEQQHAVTNITHQNAPQWLTRFTLPQNIFLAVLIEGTFEELVIRRPQRVAEHGRHDVKEMAATQRIDTHHDIAGRLIGFWTPELYGRISVPGFHFHFLDRDKKISGHVLKFHAEQATLSFQEKQTIEITQPSSRAYKELKIDLSALDALIGKIEK